MSASYTPGPHRVDGRNTVTEVGGFNLVWGNGELLAYVARDGDAQLYAAAPDLVKALRGLLAVCEMTTFSDQYPAECERARSALSKALNTSTEGEG